MKKPELRDPQYKDSDTNPSKSAYNKVFPTLAMNEMLQIGFPNISPLWKFINTLNENSQQENLEFLTKFSNLFKEHRKLIYSPEEIPNSITECVNQLCIMSERQFTEPESTKKRAWEGYNSSIESYFGSHFIQHRGRVGKILTLSQDTMLLLTNIIIGENENIRFYEIIKGLNERGVVLDKQSEQELIAFYDRIGNAERLSDSGDAVYVCKTI